MKKTLKELEIAFIEKLLNDSIRRYGIDKFQLAKTMLDNGILEEKDLSENDMSNHVHKLAEFVYESEKDNSLIDKISNKW